MSDVIPLPLEAIRWLRDLERKHVSGDGWSTEAPYVNFEELLKIGMIERRPIAFRLTAIGLWTLNRVVPEGRL